MTGTFDISPLTALAGGALIGAAASGLLLVNGRLAGISGIAAGSPRIVVERSRFETSTITR